jgi:GDPmannose 4,6-dehydratase
VLTGDLVGLGVARLLEAVAKVAPKARVFQASSSELFGRALESPQNEKTAIRPRSPYGVAKAYAHWMVAEAREIRGLFAVSGILFNHESPRRGLEFVSRKVTNAVARIHHGLQSEVALGDLDARRDWGFAGDYVDAMWRMLQHHQPMDFVIGTGRTWSVGELCETAFGVVGRDYREHVKQDPRFMRPPDPRPIVADATLARKQLGWRPVVEFPRMIEMMVQADLALVAAGK